MSFFIQYIEPLTHWLQTNPNWALLITFFISLSESLAIIGSIVPGSVTMTAIGILAGSGIMRIDYTFIASILGAICGDSLSYLIGYVYSDKIAYIWPFKKHPHWLAYGKEFFSRHGGKSVLIGRFIGPLRSIIPLIAGIMHMQQWRFLVANILSAMGWSCLYIIPGILIGTAGHELSTEVASKLFVIILIALLVIWLLSLLIKWIIFKLQVFLQNNLHDFWLSFKDKRWLNKIYLLFTPEKETDHYHTAGLMILVSFGLIISVILPLLNSNEQLIKHINLPMYLVIQSVHTSLLQNLFIICTQFTSTFTIASIYVLSLLWLIYHKKIRAIIYLSLLVITSVLLAEILSLSVDSPRPTGLLITAPGSSFPDISLLVATAIYGFVFYYINNKYSLLTNFMRTFILMILGLSGLGALYLNDYWFTDVLAAYIIGSTLCLLFCLLYRKQRFGRPKKSQSIIILSSLFIGIIFATALSSYLSFNTLAYEHISYQKQYILDQSVWWEQTKPILPLYRLNRVGKKTDLFNIQYHGNLNLLKKRLTSHGWESHSETLFTKIMMYFNQNTNELKMPILTQLYNNQSPELIMTYQDPDLQLSIGLIIWKSNYHLQNDNAPLWIGTLYPHSLASKQKKGDQLIAHTRLLWGHLLPALDQFKLRRITLSNTMLLPLFPDIPPYLLLIEEQ